MYGKIHQNTKGLKLILFLLIRHYSVFDLLLHIIVDATVMPTKSDSDLIFFF